MTDQQKVECVAKWFPEVLEGEHLVLTKFPKCLRFSESYWGPA